MIGLYAFDAIVADERTGDVGVAEETNRRVLIGETWHRIEGVKDIVPALGRIEGGVDNREVANLASEREVASRAVNP